MGVTLLLVSAERLCMRQLPVTSLLWVQSVVLALQMPVPAPCAAVHVLIPALRAVFGTGLAPAGSASSSSFWQQQGTLHLICLFPQLLLPAVLLSVWFQALLKARQHCRNPDPVVGMIAQARLE